MDVYDQIHSFASDHRNQIERRLRDTGDQIAELRGLERLLQHEFPELTPEQARVFAESFVQDASQTLRRSERNDLTASIPLLKATSTPRQIAPDNETDQQDAAKTARRQMKLNFRLVKDDRLDLTDRIVFSLLWKWAHCNHKRPRTVSIAKYRRATGFRPATIKASLNRLLTYGYISDAHQPLVAKKGKTYSLNNGIPYLGHRKLIWVNDGDIKAHVFCGIWMTNPKPTQCKPAWMAKALGISVRTASRHIAALQRLSVSL